MEKVIIKKKLKEFDFNTDEEYSDFIDIYEGEDVERMKLMMYKSFLKRGVPSNKATILVETNIDLLSKMVNLKFNNKAMMVFNKALDFIDKRLG